MTKPNKKPQRWLDTFPQGTKEGDEEQRFFIAISRNKKFQWRSISSIAKESRLSVVRIEEIIQKYYKKNMVFPNPESSDQWGYWERLDKDELQKVMPDNESIDQTDKKRRIDGWGI